MNITPNERDHAIATIITKGLTLPVSTHVFLREMWRVLGCRVIFLDIIPALLVSFVVALGYITIISLKLSLLQTGGNIYSVLFLFSPVLFLSLTLSTEVIEHYGGIYEIKMTSKYTIRQITAFRLLSFALVGMVSTILGSVIFSLTLETLQFVQLFSLTMASLFLCSLLTIYIMRRLHGGWYLGPLIWTNIGILPMLLFHENWERLLSNLPPVVTVAVATVACALFLREIKINTKGVLTYAYR